ncbi:MAG: nucleotidyltransferase domain-containing protein [Chloroflexota bacterium]
MPHETLINLTDGKWADNTLQEIVAHFEAAFPSRVIGYYLEGSYADGTAIPTSDLDLIVVFDGEFAYGEDEAATALIRTLEEFSPIELDIELIDEVTLRENANPMFKLGSQLVYGKDIRASIPLMSIEQWARQRMHAAYWLMINVFERPKPVHIPLEFPKPDAPFFGYINRPMRLTDGSEVMTTRNLIRVTGWIATARLAHEAREYVMRKRECYPTYQRVIGDEWTPLLSQIDQRVRTDWHYRIPESKVERQELCTLLEQTVAYENHFLGVYRQFVLGELNKSNHDARIEAINYLNGIPFSDPELEQALQTAKKLSEKGTSVSF